MGGGGHTESTNKTTNTNTSGSSAISGDNLGTVLSGVSIAKGASLNMTSTDHGAVKSAGEIAKTALLNNAAAVKEASNLGSKAIEANSETLSKSFDFGKSALATTSTTAQKAMAENGAVSRSAMDNVRQNGTDAISAVKAMAAQSGENARAALLMSENTASRSQIGNSGEMSKVAIAVAIALGVGFTAMVIKGAK